jgi:hypothetical protein
VLLQLSFKVQETASANQLWLPCCHLPWCMQVVQCAMLINADLPGLPLQYQTPGRPTRCALPETAVCLAGPTKLYTTFAHQFSSRGKMLLSKLCTEIHRTP